MGFKQSYFRYLIQLPCRIRRRKGKVVTAECRCDFVICEIVNLLQSRFGRKNLRLGATVRVTVLNASMFTEI